MSEVTPNEILEWIDENVDEGGYFKSKDVADDLDAKLKHVSGVFPMVRGLAKDERDYSIVKWSKSSPITWMKDVEGDMDVDDDSIEYPDESSEFSIDVENPFNGEGCVFKESPIYSLFLIDNGLNTSPDMEFADDISYSVFYNHCQRMLQVGLLDIDVKIADTGHARKCYNLTEDGERVLELAIDLFTDGE